MTRNTPRTHRRLLQPHIPAADFKNGTKMAPIQQSVQSMWLHSSSECLSVWFCKRSYYANSLLPFANKSVLRHWKAMLGWKYDFIYVIIKQWHLHTRYCNCAAAISYDWPKYDADDRFLSLFSKRFHSTLLCGNLAPVPNDTAASANSSCNSCYCELYDVVFKQKYRFGASSIALYA